MNETEAKCIVVSVWEAQRYLGSDCIVNLKMTTNPTPSSGEVVIQIEKEYEVVFSHSWQLGDTAESFLESFNTRFNSIFYKD